MTEATAKTTQRAYNWAFPEPGGEGWSFRWSGSLGNMFDATPLEDWWSGVIRGARGRCRLVRYLSDHGLLSFQSVFSPILVGSWDAGSSVFSILA